MRRSYPAVRACLRALGVPPRRLDAVVRTVYERAREDSVAAPRALLGVMAAASRAPSSPITDPHDPPARALLAAFVAPLAPRSRLLFTTNELVGASPLVLATELGIDELAIAGELVALRRRFAAFAESYGVPPGELLLASVACERLPEAEENALWDAIEVRLVAALPPARRPHSRRKGHRRLVSTTAATHRA